MQEGNLVFVGCQLSRSSGEGFSGEVLNRESLERLAASFLAEHLEFGDCAVGFDLVSMLISKNNRAILRHHRNVLREL